MNINHTINEIIVKKIFGNSHNKILYLQKLQEKITHDLNLKNIMSMNELNEMIIKYWNYDISKRIIRGLFKQTDKYKRGKCADEIMRILINEWNNKKLGPIDWPFSQGQFDNFVQKINNSNDDGNTKDDKVKLAAIQFRRLKEINTLRNDFLETLIFEKNENVVPTLKHSRSCDFFINGLSYDQKVSRSVTKQFKRDFGKNWKEKAINNPPKVAEYLYKYQDEGRFGSDRRMLIVYLDENVPVENIKTKIQDINLEKPYNIDFEYYHKSTETKKYNVDCFCILLH